jgi:hypothetical protein
MSLRTLTLAASLALAATSVGCGSESPRMRVVTQHVRAGELVVVRFAAPLVAQFGRGDVWLTLVPAAASDEFAGERVVIEEGADEAAVPATAEGRYELRLVDRSPRRLSRVVARLSLDVDRAAVARNEAPAWYW